MLSGCGAQFRCVPVVVFPCEVLSVAPELLPELVVAAPLLPLLPFEPLTPLLAPVLPLLLPPDVLPLLPPADELPPLEPLLLLAAMTGAVASTRENAPASSADR